jgi:cytochrome c
VDRDKEGPALAGVYGRAAGSVASFQYSPALQKSKLRWTSETLDKWLTDPDKLVPNNDMSFSVPNPDERSAIIAYLKEISKK